MKVCVFYTSPKLGDIILQLPFIKAIANHYNTKVTLCVNKYINIKAILESQNYIKSVIENPFRRGRFYFYDLLNLYRELKKEKIDCAFILEKTKAPAIACKIAKIDKIYGFGIGSQKFFVNNSVSLSKNDIRKMLSEYGDFDLDKILNELISEYESRGIVLSKTENRFFF